MDSIFADYNSTTPLCQDVIDHFNSLQSFVGNISSGHQFGQHANAIYNQATDSIRRNLGADSFEFFSCSSATEANHWFFYSLLKDVTHCPRVIISSIEHPCVIEPLQHYHKQGIIDLAICSVDSLGFLDLAHFKSLLTTNTLFVSIMFANNEIGTIQPIEEIVQLSKNVGAIVHSDIAQAAGKIPLNLDLLGLDAVSISSHKCYAPTGCGALLIRNSSLLSPLFLGGSQQHKLRAGTVDVMGVSLFSKGLDYCYRMLVKHLDIGSWATKLQKRYPDIHLISSPNRTGVLWNTVSLAIPQQLSHDIMMALDLLGIAVSTGNACSTGSVSVSDTILALGIKETLASSVIRLTFGYPTTTQELNFIFENFNFFFKNSDH